jgi:hypothetical protein
MLSEEVESPKPARTGKRAGRSAFDRHQVDDIDFLRRTISIEHGRAT